MCSMPNCCFVAIVLMISVCGSSANLEQAVTRVHGEAETPGPLDNLAAFVRRLNRMQLDTSD